MSMMHCSLLSLGCAFGFAPPQEDNTLTALRALKIAQRRLRPEVRTKLLSISSPRTNGSLTPTAWRFTFSDPGTSGHCRVVTVAAKASSEHPDTVEAFASAKTEDVNELQAIPQNKLLIDSDKVLSQIRAGSKMKGLKWVEYRLVQPRSTKEPLWQLCFYSESGDTVAGFKVGAKSGAMEMNQEHCPDPSVCEVGK